MNMVDNDPDDLDKALKTGSGFTQILEPGFLKLKGPDRISFIQRQSTNDVQLTANNRSVPTVLTSATARILDVLTCFNEPGNMQEPELCVLTLPGRGEKTLQYLKSRIFFMDKVEIHDLSSSYAQFDVFGPETEALLGKAEVLSDADWTHIPQSLSIPGDEDLSFWIIPPKGVFGMGCRMIVPTERSAAFQSWLISSGIIRVEPKAYEFLRIEAGLPGEKTELTEDYTPLEARLEALVSDSKGCYTGQEIIARQITYDKVTRKLTGVMLSQEAGPGSSVLVEGKNIGQITSSTISPSHGPIGLAVLKRPFFETGTRVSIDFEGQTFAGKTTGLPF
jgi:folate-binding protein YgfZ